MLTDTAGLRESMDQIEMEGVRRAKKQLQEADIVLLVTEASTSRKELENLIDETEVYFINTIIRMNFRMWLERNL